MSTSCQKAYSIVITALVPGVSVTINKNNVEYGDTFIVTANVTTDISTTASLFYGGILITTIPVVAGVAKWTVVAGVTHNALNNPISLGSNAVQVTSHWSGGVISGSYPGFHTTINLPTFIYSQDAADYFNFLSGPPPNGPQFTVAVVNNVYNATGSFHIFMTGPLSSVTGWNMDINWTGGTLYAKSDGFPFFPFGQYSLVSTNQPASPATMMVTRT